MEAQPAAEHAGDMRQWGEKPSANQILSFHWVKSETWKASSSPACTAELEAYWRMRLGGLLIG
jgi:hypothetical protein